MTLFLSRLLITYVVSLVELEVVDHSPEDVLGRVALVFGELAQLLLVSIDDPGVHVQVLAIGACFEVGRNRTLVEQFRELSLQLEEGVEGLFSEFFVDGPPTARPA